MTTTRPRARSIYCAVRSVYWLLRRLYRAARRVPDLLIDRRLNVETAQEVRLVDLGLSDRHRVNYQPAGWLDLRRTLDPAGICSDDVFLDLGSGKGRILLAAARYHFRRVIGVEISERLIGVARRNLETSRTRRLCGHIELVNADVTEFRIPDEVTIVYLFNPFRGPVFEAVVAQLIASVDRRPRTVRVIYRNAREHQQLMDTGRFVLMRVTRGLPPVPDRDIRLYVLGPAPFEARADRPAATVMLRERHQASV